MVFISPRQNRLLTILVFLFLISLIPPILEASIHDYNPDIDIALGDCFLIIHENENFTVSGLYIGALYLMESPLIKNLFSTTRFYGIYNFGTVFINGENNRTILFLPIFIDIGYKFQLFKRFEILPFAGWGLGVIPNDYPEINRSIMLSVNAGILIRFRLWSTAYLKLIVEYGTIFGNQFPDRGYANYMRIVYPIPFIP